MMEQEYSADDMEKLLACRQDRTLSNVKNLGMANLFYKEVLPEGTPSAACYQEQPTPTETHNCGMDYYANYANNTLSNMPKMMPNQQQGGSCGCNGQPQPKENNGKNCGCNGQPQPKENCGCNGQPQPKENCGYTEQSQPKQSCGYSVHAQPKQGCDHSEQPQPKPHCGYTEMSQPKQNGGCTDLEATMPKCPYQMMPHTCGTDYGQQLNRMEQMLREMYMTNQELFKSILNYCKTYTIK